MKRLKRFWRKRGSKTPKMRPQTSSQQVAWQKWAMRRYSSSSNKRIIAVALQSTRMEKLCFRNPCPPMKTDLKKLSLSMIYQAWSSHCPWGAWLKEWASFDHSRKWLRMLKKKQPSNTTTLVVEIKCENMRTRTIEWRHSWCWLQRGAERKSGCPVRQYLTSEVVNIQIKSQV